MLSIRRTFGAAIFTMFSLQANAGLIHQFDFINMDAPEVLPQIDMYDAGLALQVSGWTTSFNSDGEQKESWQPVSYPGIFYADLGLGLISSDDDGPFLDGGSSSYYDEDPDEGFLLVFSHTVSLDMMFFEGVGRSDDINISLVDFSSGIPELQISFHDIEPEFGVIAANDPSSALVGKAFMLWVDGDDDSVALAGLQVTRVPLPATALLMALGLVMLRRFRRG
ncbi:hypothetical protein [Bowmanella denitrificans]|uniref:hypothetical protein n=1 Tax=Bowmanella denitrificans TaxID=366582 RepID=UPI000C9CDB96|nr:hypothetical protein [Bowmanella denitrificans]